jgi:glycosyltransferase involved in cell wall biosynthesis
MGKVFLIGAGPLPSEDPRQMGFPALRTRQFLLPMLAAGHDVTLATLVDGRGQDAPDGVQDRTARTPRGDRPYRSVAVRADVPGRFLMLRDLRRDTAPDVVVTAGPFLPMAAGARAAGDEPLWVDVPGDPMSEAQARSYRSGSTDPIHRYREMLGWALARGDRFSVISRAQRGPLIGALGLAGRMTAEAMGHELVHVQPGSVEALDDDLGAAGAAPEGLDALPADAFVVLFCGGYNTWLDDDTMLQGLLRAMDRDPSIRFVSTGGALRGHEEGTYHRFSGRAAGSAHAARFHFLGWVPTRALPAVFARAQLALFCDLPCYEAEFGARTRILEALERGVPVAATDSCDLTHELSGCALFHPLREGDAEDVARRLVDLAGAHRSGTTTSSQRDLRPWSLLRERYSLEATTQPLLRWIDSPSRSPGGVPIDFLEDYWQELARLQDRLEEVWNSPTWKVLGRLHKALSRLRWG